MHVLSLAPAHTARLAVLQDAVQCCAVCGDVRYQQQAGCPSAQRRQAPDGACKPQHAAAPGSIWRRTSSQHGHCPDPGMVQQAYCSLIRWHRLCCWNIQQQRLHVLIMPHVQSC